MPTRSEGGLQVRDFPGTGELAALLPPAAAESAPFFAALAEGRLVLQSCSACERMRSPAAPVCPYCGCETATWREHAGDGVVHSWIRYRRSYLPQFEPLMPYVVVCVALDQGPRLFGRLADDGPDRDPYVGMPVETVVERWPGGEAVHAFTRAREDEQ